MGLLIRNRRKALGLSQEELAEKVGISYQQVQRYENGGTMLNVENLQRIAQVLFMPVATFFETDHLQHIAEPATTYISSEERNLLKSFRALSEEGDRKMAIQIVRRLVRR
ncbi:MAG: helix-turn-helix transcriptional regulator [Geobacteraceae bacterium]|nr:helix-turn-helix transcriptional regulator [Geobacteraceae bacterium]